MKSLQLSMALAAILPASVCAGTIFSDLFNSGSSGAIGGLQAVTWTQTGSYQNVVIGANLATNNGLSTSTGTAYLMNQIGPGTTAANEVTSPFAIVMTGNPGINVMTQLFSGLSLGPGTYYLVIAPDPGTFTLVWDATSPALQTLDSGVTQGSDLVLSGAQDPFAPASPMVAASLSRIVSVTGDPVVVSGTPEPSTIGTMLAGLAGLGLVRSRAKQRLRTSSALR